MNILIVIIAATAFVLSFGIFTIFLAKSVIKAAVNSAKPSNTFNINQNIGSKLVEQMQERLPNLLDIAIPKLLESSEKRESDEKREKEKKQPE